MATNPGAVAQNLVSGNTRGQPDQRRYAKFRDQHGRTWGGVIEVRTGDLVSPAEALFQAPVIPPSEFVRVTPGEFNVVEIDYHAWRQDIAIAEAEWQDLLRQAAMNLGAQGQVGSLIENPTPEVLHITGPRPRDRPGFVDDVVVQACMAGNRWVLFGEGAMPKAAVPFFEKKSVSVRAARLTPAVVYDPFAEGEDEEEEDDGPAVSYEAAKPVIPPEEYELKMTSPGRWQMPDAATLQGSRADAEHALEQLFPEHHLAMIESVVVETAGAE